METLERLEKKKTKYQRRSQYFKGIGFDNLSEEFQDVVNLIEEIESYIKENINGQS